MIGISFSHLENNFQENRDYVYVTFSNYTSFQMNNISLENNFQENTDYAYVTYD